MNKSYPEVMNADWHIPGPIDINTVRYIARSSCPLTACLSSNTLTGPGGGGGTRGKLWKDSVP